MKSLTRLIAVADPVLRAAYILAAYTGIRRGELKKLEWRDLTLDCQYPVMRLREGTTKNKQKKDIALHHAASRALQEIRPSENAKGLVFPRLPEFKGMKKHRIAANIPFIDDNGLRTSFHSLCHSFCTILHKAGVPQRTAQDVMRHSNPKLTADVYTDTLQLNTRAGCL